MSTVILDTITGKSTATTITIGSTPVVSASANSMTIKGEGSAQTSIQQGLIKMWYDIDSTGTFELEDSFNVSSASDGGTGVHTANYTNNAASARYSMNMGAQSQTDIGFTSRDASSVTLLCRGGTGADAIDIDGIFGNLAGDLA